MIVKFLEFLTEYLSIIFCMNKVARKQIKIHWYSLLDFICYVLMMYAVQNAGYGKLIIFSYWFVYTKIRVANTWQQTVKTFIGTICIIPMLQILIYAAISERMQTMFDAYFMATSTNILIIIVVLLCKQKHLAVLMNLVTKFRKVLFLILLLCLFKCLFSYFSEYKLINAYFMDPLATCFLIMALMVIIGVSAENEKKHKAEELRIYKLYTKTFEDAVMTIRMKQHEFDNHINAIKCMRYTIHDMGELIDEQDKYCNKILQDNKYNKLLKLKMSPILIGYLYSKFTAASAQGMNIDYEVQDVNIECVNILINDLIEIIGILFDNAVDALRNQIDREIQVRILFEDDKFIISIANISSWKTNSEIEKFFEYGYSTKGKEHGIGLCRANTILKQYKASMQVENVTINDMNYLCFKVVI